MKTKAFVLALLVLVAGCDIFDPASDVWKDPVALEFEEYDFKDSGKEKLWEVTYVGDHDKREVQCTTNKEWLSVELPDRYIARDVRFPIKLIVNRSQLGEGEDTAEVELLIGERIKRKLVVKATGVPDIVISPLSVDLLTSISQIELTLYSRLNFNTVYLSSPDSWIHIQPTSLHLPESPYAEDVKTAVVTCDRSKLSPGSHTGHVIVKTMGGWEQQILLKLFVPEQSEQVVSCDNWIFSCDKAYRVGTSQVELLVDVHNTTGIYDELIFSGATSTAEDAESNMYKASPNNKSLLVPKDDVKSIAVRFNDVPETVTDFKKVCLDFGLSEIVTFENITF